MDTEIWKRFIKGDENALYDVPNRIAISWKTCYFNQIDPYLNKPKKIFTTSELKNRKQKKQELIRLVQTEITQIKGILQIKKPLFIMTDENGAIIWRDGNHQAKDFANDIFFREGSRWTEMDVGTNAIGLALKTKKEEVVSSEEHYSVASRNWSCAAAPIVDMENNVLGVLDVSTYQNNSAKESIFLLSAITQKISNYIFKYELEQKQALLTYAARRIEKSKEILCDTTYKVINMPEDYEDIFKWNENIYQYLKKDMLFDKKEIFFEGKLIGYRFIIHYIPESQASFYHAGVETKNENYSAFLTQAITLAKSHLPIHIFGESGSGKEMVARTIHFNSKEKSGPLVAINCGALNEALLESELFGYEAGAFTGANIHGYKGKIEQASGGSLFLDEIDSMSSKMQAALLRVLEDKQVTPISGQPKKVSFRLITASNQDIRKKVIEKSFREDLFYRIYVGKLVVPPLRERIEDLWPLIEDFCKKKNWSISWKNSIFQAAKEFPWPGNIREFQNFLERLYVFYPYTSPSKQQIEELITSTEVEGGNLKLAEREGMKMNIREELKQALEKEHYHMTNTAKRLGISRATLYRRMREYGLD